MGVREKFVFGVRTGDGVDLCCAAKAEGRETGESGGLRHTTLHCVMVTAQGAELVRYESATLSYGRGGSGSSKPLVGNGRSRELCDAQELARWKLQALHFRLDGLTARFREPGFGLT